MKNANQIGQQADYQPDYQPHTTGYNTPPGGFPQANPNGTRVSISNRAACVPSADASREMGAYGESEYTTAVAGARRQTQQGGSSPRRGRAQPSTPNNGPTDADAFAFDSNA